MHVMDFFLLALMAGCLPVRPCLVVAHTRIQSIKNWTPLSKIAQFPMFSLRLGSPFVEIIPCRNKQRLYFVFVIIVVFEKYLIILTLGCDLFPFPPVKSFSLKLIYPVWLSRGLLLKRLGCHAWPCLLIKGQNSSISLLHLIHMDNSLCV